MFCSFASINSCITWDDSHSLRLEGDAANSASEVSADGGTCNWMILDALFRMVSLDTGHVIHISMLLFIYIHSIFHVFPLNNLYDLNCTSVASVDS